MADNIQYTYKVNFTISDKESQKLIDFIKYVEETMKGTTQLVKVNTDKSSE